MGRRDPRIDAYIAKSADFAQPLLAHFRALVHRACPDVIETIKWGMPHFEYKGILCQMAAFKAHCAFGFWHGTLLFGEDHPKANEAMGHLGRITGRQDLPSDKVLLGYLRKAVDLANKGVKVPRGPRKAKPPARVPSDLAAALKKDKAAGVAFKNFSPSHRREYIEWITEAKTDETRQRRLQSALTWMAEGKSRHWKHRS